MGGGGSTAQAKDSGKRDNDELSSPYQKYYVVCYIHAVHTRGRLLITYHR